MSIVLKGLAIAAMLCIFTAIGEFSTTSSSTSLSNSNTNIKVVDKSIVVLPHKITTVPWAGRLIHTNIDSKIIPNKDAKLIPTTILVKTIAIHETVEQPKFQLKATVILPQPKVNIVTVKPKIVTNIYYHYTGHWIYHLIHGKMYWRWIR
jgi:hypothetical protein